MAEIKQISDDLIASLSENVIVHFKKICEVVPRGSKKETAMCEFLKDFVDGLNETKEESEKISFTRQSETKEGKPINNIVLEKPASKGYENVPPVALQAHLDMVCQKVDGSAHDFDKPVEIEEKVKVIDGKEVRVMTSKNEETTLGADDGIGVAAIMAILESGEVSHPKIQAVFTSDEEDGMSGAKWLDKSLVTAKSFINIDAETEGTLYYGCAGGIYANVDIPVSFVELPAGMSLFEIEISGLLGGHSGLEIGEKRANANRLMGRALNILSKDFAEINSEIMLADISGGSAKNAITKKAAAVVAVNDGFVQTLKQSVEKIIEMFKYEYGSLEKEMVIKLTQKDGAYEKVMTKETFYKIVTVIMTVPNGVLDMHIDVEGLVETSSNLGVIGLSGEFVSLTCFIRSFIESKKQFVVEQIKLIAESVGARFVADTDFPEWNPNPDSALLDLFEKTYNRIFEKEIAKKEKTKAICASVHAGLECGHFFKKFFDEKTLTSVDLIAIGPTISDAHVPTETLHISTVSDVMKLLLTVLSEMKDGDSSEMCSCNRIHKRTARKIVGCNCMV